MFNFLKYLPLLLKLKDIAEVYKQETGENKPWYLSRTFVGSIIAFVFTCLTVFLGIEFDQGQITFLTDNISTMITTGIALYGVIMSFIGQIFKKQ